MQSTANTDNPTMRELTHRYWKWEASIVCSSSRHCRQLEFFLALAGWRSVGWRRCVLAVAQQWVWGSRRFVGILSAFVTDLLYRWLLGDRF
jgi:hypothetical protein